ncbi:MAG: efflux RND transporter permease subunit [Polyangiaceae bacterium]
MISKLLVQRRVVLTVATLLALVGALAYGTMPRQEDPTMPPTWAMVIASYPGADAQKVERLVVTRLEEELAEVQELKHVAATIRQGIAVVSLELRDDVSDHDAAWDEVETRLRKAQSELPAGVGPLQLNRDLIDNQSILLAVTGNQDPLVLTDAAEKLEKKLLSLGDVVRVETAGAPREEVRIELEDSAQQRFGIGPQDVARAISANNTGIPGGSVRAGERVTTLRPASELDSVEDVRRLPVRLPGGETTELSKLASVRRMQGTPVTERVRYQGDPAVILGVVARNKIDAVEFGKHVRNAVDASRSELAPLQVHELTFQPARVEQRLSSLGQSLLLGVGIVALVLVVAMGLRLGLLVSSVVPLVAAASLGIYAMAGGVLHQISIAALVLALGMLVDNAIVVAEGIQRRVDGGMARGAAALATVRELALPLGSATGTTLAAFVPMLLSEGPTAEFTRSIPIIVMLTLAVSYVFAITVTPVLGGWLLRPGKQSEGWMERLGARLGDLVLRRKASILVAALVAVVASGALATRVEQRFFPSADRNQLIVSLELPEGAHIDAIDARARRVERWLADDARVHSVSAFVGRATPKFYYNVLDRPSSPHLAQLLVTTRDNADVETVATALRQYVQQELPELELVARPLEQGPPVRAPIEVRLRGQDLPALSRAAEQVLTAVRAVPGTRDVRHDLGIGVPTLRYDVQDSVALDYGVGRNDVARALLASTHGIDVGQLRSGEDLIPIVVRDPRGETMPAERVATLGVATPAGASLPVAQLAASKVQWQPAMIQRRDRQRLVRVEAELMPDVPFSRVLAQVEQRLAQSSLPAGVRVEMAGAKEGSGQANGAMLRTLPIGMLLLVFILLVEFNSFRRLGIVLVTIPLAATGVIPGLVFAGQPFGFMSLLGVFALIGIVVNNAIVLIDVTDGLRREGMALEAALREGIRRRTRPILLTTTTTVAGLLPLALSSTSLWPPLAWSMISGLAASTALTLLVAPALYALLLRREAGEAPAVPTAMSTPAQAAV